MNTKNNPKADAAHRFRIENKVSGEVNALSLVVRKYIARHCVTLASLMLERSVSLSRDEQAQNNKNHLSLKGVTNK